jgi:uncharacterized protein (TIRG00374 family)
VPPRLLRSLVVALALGAVVALALALAASLDATLEALRRFRWGLLPVAVAAVLVNWGLRFAKWHYYLRRLAVPLPWPTSVLVFLAGFTMAISPGKLGEVLKAVLVRDRVGTEVSRTASAVMAERLTDVAGLLVLSAFGATALPGGPLVLALAAAAVAAAVVALRLRASSRLARRVLADRWLDAGPVLALRRFVHAGRALLAPGPLAVAIGLSVVSWAFECLALHVVLGGLGAALPLRGVTVAYAFASLAGALSMLPGGLGVAEGSLTALLVGLGAPGPVAAAGTLLGRAATLWLAVAVGVVTLLAAFRSPAGRPGSPPREADRRA